MTFKVHFMGVGAARSGTTWLASILSQHPSVYIPRKKELHYFNNDAKYSEDLENFKKHFNGVDAHLKLGEFTPRYAINEKAIARISHHFPNIKILFLVRDPVERAYSQYLYFRTIKGKEKNSDFERALEGQYKEDYLYKSLYYNQIIRLYESFGQENVKIIVFEEMINEQERSLKEIFRFIEVDDNFSPDWDMGKVNDSVKANSALAFNFTRLNKYFMESFYRIFGRSNENMMTYLNKLLRNNKLSDDVKKRVFYKYFADDVFRLKRDIEVDISRWNLP